MNQTAMAYEQLIERFIVWAQTQDDLRAAIVIGSRARADRPADKWSDLDVIIAASACFWIKMEQSRNGLDLCVLPNLCALIPRRKRSFWRSSTTSGIMLFGQPRNLVEGSYGPRRSAMTAI